LIVSIVTWSDRPRILRRNYHSPSGIGISACLGISLDLTHRPNEGGVDVPSVGIGQSLYTTFGCGALQRLEDLLLQADGLTHGGNQAVLAPSWATTEAYLADRAGWSLLRVGLWRLLVPRKGS
jgi:hypothetical protein